MTDNSDINALSTTIKKIQSFISSTSKTEIKNELAIVKLICEKGVAQRVVAGKEGAYTAILNLMKIQEKDDDIEIECLNTMISLMTGQPDLLDVNGVEFMMKSLKIQQSKDIQSLILKWIRECCFKHENNR